MESPLYTYPSLLAPPRARASKELLLFAPSTELLLYIELTPWKLMPPAVPSDVSPGVSNTNCSQRRELIGRLLTKFSLTFCDCSVFSVSSRGVSAVTVTRDCVSAY